MHAFLNEWEAAYPMAEPVAPEDAMSDEERMQLEAIGYLGVELDDPAQ